MNCAPKSYDTGYLSIGSSPYKGAFAQTSFPKGRDEVVLVGIDQPAWTFPTPSYTDDNEDVLDVREQVNTVLLAPPADDAFGVTYGDVNGMTVIERPSEFRVLLGQKTQKITVDDSGTRACSGASSSCTVTWDINPEAYLTRLKVYRTTRDYPK